MNRKFQTNQSIVLLGLPFSFAVVFLLFSSTTAQQITPNPNLAGDTIYIYSSDYFWNLTDYLNQGTIDNEGVFTNQVLGTILGTIDNSGTINKWESGQINSDRFADKTQNIAISGNTIADPIVGAISTVIPVLGDYGKGKVSSYALYNLMKDNRGYDVVIYPQYETKKFIIPIFYFS